MPKSLRGPAFLNEVDVSCDVRLHLRVIVRLICPARRLVFLKVERDSYCSEILKLRMSEGLLHKADVWDNVETFDGANSNALGAGGGFPCQARVVVLSVSSHFFVNAVLELLRLIINLLDQGISQAGFQLGLSDSRSVLVKHCFRIFDSLPQRRALTTYIVQDHMAHNQRTTCGCGFD